MDDGAIDLIMVRMYNIMEYGTWYDIKSAIIIISIYVFHSNISWKGNDFCPV